MSSPIVQASNFVVSKVSIAPPNQIKGAPAGAKMAYVSYNDSRFMMQTPCLRTPFGLNIFDKSTPPKYSVSVSLDDYKTNPKNKAFHDALVALDKYMIDQGVKNSKLWLGKEMSRELVTHSYTPCLKAGKEKDGNVYPPTFKISLGRDPKTQNFVCDFWRKSESGGVEQFTDTPIEKILPRRAELTCILQCTGVWFAAGKFGLSWKAKQIRVDRVPEGISGYGFAEDGEDLMDDAEEFSAPAGKSMIRDDDDSDAEEAAPAPANTQVAVDSDDDEEETVQAPVVQPSVKKTPAAIAKRKAPTTTKGK